MFKRVKPDYSKLLSRTKKGADAMLRDREKLNRLVESASVSIDSGVSRMNSIKSDLGVLLSLIKAWARGDYRGVSKTTLLLSAGAVLYFVNPVDAIPDILPLTGFLDDATVIGIVITSVKKDIENFKLWESAQTEFMNSQQPATRLVS